MIFDYIKDIEVDLELDSILIYHNSYLLTSLFKSRESLKFKLEGLCFEYKVLQIKNNYSELILSVQNIGDLIIGRENSNTFVVYHLSKIKINMAKNPKLIKDYISGDRKTIYVWRTPKQHKLLMSKFKTLSEKIKLIKKFVK